MTTTSEDQNRVTVHAEYVFVIDGPCHECALISDGACRDLSGAFPCCRLNGRTDGKTGNWQEVPHA